MEERISYIEESIICSIEEHMKFTFFQRLLILLTGNIFYSSVTMKAIARDIKVSLDNMSTAFGDDVRFRR